ncbi:MAG: peptidase T [Candidatus Eisenbacteria bacterium]
MDTLLDRFLRYVKVETTAVDETEDVPSSPGQLVLGKMLAEEMKSLGLENVVQNEFGIVIGTVPGNVKGAPVMAWLAHVDTSPEAGGKDVKPVIHEKYDGGDIVLPGDKTKVIRVSDTDHLEGLAGKTLITSDGTTLLGADDKAGVANIMTAAAKLMADPDIEHGPIRVVFTCDEEVGRGTDKIDLKQIGAAVAYTVDGESAGLIEGETFSADLATVTITGYNVHPGLATGKMVNAIRLAGQFITRMPRHRLAPETTAGKEGFLHPYVLEGSVAEAKIKILLRSFDSAELPEQAELLRKIAATVAAEHPKAKIDVAVKKQYRNMADHMKEEPRAMKLAALAVKRAGMEPKIESIRGGTDGARLAEMGLPTPNLSAGMHNFHSPLEFACLEEMEQSVKVLVELAKLWGKEKA